MLRRLILSCALTLGVSASALAGTIGWQSADLPYGLMYSPSSSPFEAFEWTPLDFAAFSAYGGDFANVRRPVTQVHFFEDPFTPASPPAPDDEQAPLLLSIPYFDGMSRAQARMALQELPLLDEQGPDDSIPEPGILALIGVGLLGLSARVRRAYQAAGR